MGYKEDDAYWPKHHDIAGIDIDVIIGECVGCGETGKMYANLHSDEHEIVVQMCEVCYGLAREYTEEWEE